MNNQETLNPNFDINAKYEDMIKRAKHNVDLYLETGKDCSDISLSYDVKNYLPKVLEEIERLNNIINETKEKLKFALKCKDSELQCVFEAYEIEEMINKLELKEGK